MEHLDFKVKQNAMYSQLNFIAWFSKVVFDSYVSLFFLVNKICIKNTHMQQVVS